MIDDVASLLLRAGLIRSSDLDATRLLVATEGGTVPELLVRYGYIEDEALTAFYLNRLLIPRVPASLLSSLDLNMLQTVHPDMAVEYRSIPISCDSEGNLTLVMSDPSNTRAVDEIGFFTGSYIVRAIATQSQIAWCLSRYYQYKTNFYKELVARGRWEEQSMTPARNIEPVSKREQSISPLASPAKIPSFFYSKTTKSGLSVTESLPLKKPRLKQGKSKKINVQARGKRTPKRPQSQQPSPPELFARAGEIQSLEPQFFEQKLRKEATVLISLDIENQDADHGNDAIVQEIQRGTDTSPILLSDVHRLPAEDDTDPIVLERLPRKRRTSKHTNIGLGAISSFQKQLPIEDTLAAEAERLKDEESQTLQLHKIRSKTLAGPSGPTSDSLKIKKELSVPVVVAEEVDSNLLMHLPAPSTPIPISIPAQSDKTTPHEQPTSILNAERKDSAGRILLLLRSIDKAQTKLEVVVPILEFLSLIFKRTGFFAVKNENLLRSWKLHNCPESMSVQVDLNLTGTFRDVVQMRLPYNGPVEDSTTKEFAIALGISEAENLLVLPVELRDRVVGVFVGLESYNPVRIEHASLIGQAAKEAFERLLTQKKRSQLTRSI